MVGLFFIAWCTFHVVIISATCTPGINNTQMTTQSVTSEVCHSATDICLTVVWNAVSFSWN